MPGPRFIRQDRLGRGTCVRRVGNLFYTHDFAEVLFQEMILHNAKAVPVSSHDLKQKFHVFYIPNLAEKEPTTRVLQVKSIWPRLMLNAVRAGSELVNLLPSNTARWWPLVEDVFSSEKCE